MRLQHLLFASATLIQWVFAAPSHAAPAKRNIGGGRTSNFAQQGKGNGQISPVKYFLEPSGSLELAHYDIRYFQGQVVSYEERGETLTHLVRSYLTLFSEMNIETWIAHGTLLGWWWNGKIMPFDFDLDTQVSASTLSYLADNLNMTMHNYTTKAPDGSVSHRQYLLDVNPFHVERVMGDGQNVIDARWIDTHNGLFIDITGLSETQPAQQPGVWSCKNSHRYRTRDLYPLRETFFEGVPALVPYAFDKILTEEYTNRALTKTFHEGHRWIPERKEWVPEANDQARTKARNGPEPHIPRSLQPESEPKPGLTNLFRLF